MDAEKTHRVFDWLWTSGQVSERDIESLPALAIEKNTVSPMRKP